MNDMCRIINTLDDLDQVQDTHTGGSLLVVVEDKNQRVWHMVEDVGVLWGVTRGDTAPTWRPAQEILAANGPLRVLQDLTEQIATEVRRWQQVADAAISEASGPPCKVPFGWHIAYPDVRLEFDGESACGDPVWERNVDWGLTPTELEADRNAAQGRAEIRANPECQEGK